MLANLAPIFWYIYTQYFTCIFYFPTNQVQRYYLLDSSCDSCTYLKSLFMRSKRCCFAVPNQVFVAISPEVRLGYSEERGNFVCHGCAAAVCLGKFHDINKGYNNVGIIWNYIVILIEMGILFRVWLISMEHVDDSSLFDSPGKFSDLGNRRILGLFAVFFVGWWI